MQPALPATTSMLADLMSLFSTVAERAAAPVTDGPPPPLLDAECVRMALTISAKYSPDNAAAAPSADECARVAQLLADFQPPDDFGECARQLQAVLYPATPLARPRRGRGAQPR